MNLREMRLKEQGRWLWTYGAFILTTIVFVVSGFIALCIVACSSPPKPTLEDCLARNPNWQSLKKEESNTAEFWQKAEMGYKECVK